MNDPLTNGNLHVLKNLDVWSTYSKCKNKRKLNMYAEESYINNWVSVKGWTAEKCCKVAFILYVHLVHYNFYKRANLFFRWYKKITLAWYRKPYCQIKLIKTISHNLFIICYKKQHNLKRFQPKLVWKVCEFEKPEIMTAENNFKHEFGDSENFFWDT